MKKLFVMAMLLGSPAMAVPVVPNFSQGSMTSHTETTQKITETINSMDYSTGYTYSVTGSNIKETTGRVNLPSTTTSNTIEGVSSTWTGLEVGTTNWQQINPAEAFQFTESYTGPGLINQTIIQRETIVESITDTTSVFQQ